MAGKKGAKHYRGERIDAQGRHRCGQCEGFFPIEECVKDARPYKECKVCYRLRRYGLTRETYALLPGADGICALCECAPSTHIDHDHTCCPGRRSCGQCVRAVLCSMCNHRVGHLEAIVAGGLLLKSLDYLDSDTRQKVVLGQDQNHTGVIRLPHDGDTDLESVRDHPAHGGLAHR